MMTARESVETTDCIEKMDIASMTSPIGFHFGASMLEN